MTQKIPWIGTSWKMNKLRAEALAFADAVLASDVAHTKLARPFVIPPFPYVAEVAARFSGTRVQVGAQNMHWDDQGAWTGEVSPLMLKDCGASVVELGHSERRAHFGETDETVALKTEAAVRHGLLAVVCVGDTREEYDAGQTAVALERQVRALLSRVGARAVGQVIIAYEPVWSIGAGGTPASPDFANAQHSKISHLVEALIGAKLPIIYGGSVNPQNCVELAKQQHIDGLFIGRSAWAAEGYIGIVNQVVEALAES